MRSISRPNGWYADALPDGRFVVLNMDGSCSSSDGPIAAPTDGSGGCLYPRLSPAAPGISFAGQAWQGFMFSSLVWSNGEWEVIPDGNSGVYGCIYLPDGTLVVNTGSAGSQGYRYVRPDNTIATGDETYGPNPYGLFEWTALASDLIVGQGQHGGALVWDRGTVRVLVDPPAGVRFIHATATGQTDADTFGLAFWGESGVPTTCMWGTLAELRALPVYQSAPTPQPPTPLPPQPPEVPMVLTAEFVANHAAAVVLGKGATKYERRFNALKFSNTVAIDANAREGRERYAILAGYGAESDVEGHKADIICDRVTGYHFDVVASSEDADAHTAWTDNGPMDPSRFRSPKVEWMIGNVPPVPQPPVPVPPTPVPPTPGQPTNADIYAAIARVEAKLERIFR